VSGSFVARDNSVFNDLFNDEALAKLDEDIAKLKVLYRENIVKHKAQLMQSFKISPSSSGYQQNTLTISQGSFDISWSRFSEYFPSIGAIVFSLAALGALSIVFVGRF
jgi:hypothetical protein